MLNSSISMVLQGGIIVDHSQQKYQIFISYRRDGSDAHARVFYEKLKDKGYTVFLDFESLFSGGFEPNIMNAIDDCDDFILLLPKDGFSRCNDENDLLRKEIHQAIIMKKNIIPIFIGGFVMPNKKDLPDDICIITEKNWFACTMEYFDAVFEKLLRNLVSIPKDECLYSMINCVKEKTLTIQHEYFKKWVYIKLNSFLSENESFFNGTNWTNPHSEQTFGIEGIGYTKKSIKAITSVSDYWEDTFTVEYLNRQAELVKDGILISRIFVLDKPYDANAMRQMKYQYDLGIKVFYIEKGDAFINPEWLTEDYLIQDDTLLVQIYCASHKYESQEKNEMITMDPTKVSLKIERYQRILERSTLFRPSDCIK